MQCSTVLFSFPPLTRLLFYFLSLSPKENCFFIGTFQCTRLDSCLRGSSFALSYGKYIEGKIDLNATKENQMRLIFRLTLFSLSPLSLKRSLSSSLRKSLLLLLLALTVGCCCCRPLQLPSYTLSTTTVVVRARLMREIGDALVGIEGSL